MKADEILNEIKNVSHNLKWKDIESFCADKGFKITPSKKGYKVYVVNSVW